jgi:hypothetical protein
MTEIITAIIAFGGTVFGSLGGILIANRLTNYRIEQLERKVEKHNNLVERITAIEYSAKAAHKRIDEIKE